MMRYLGVSALALALSMTFAVGAFAQGAPTIEGAIPDQLKERQLRQRRAEAERERARNEAPDLEIASPEEVADADQGLCFPISSIDVEGITRLEPAKVEAIIEPYVNSCMGQVAVDTLLQLITQAYLDKGLITSRAFLPEQDITTGRLLVVVVEGFVEDYFYVESKQGRLRPGKMNKIRGAFVPGPGDLVQLRQLEQGIDVMNRPKSANVKMDIVPGEQLGGSVLKLTNEVGDQTRFYVGTQTKADDTGYVRSLDLSFERDNLFNANETIFLGYSGSVNSNAVSASLTLPYRYWTATLSGNYSENAQLLTPTTELYEQTLTTSANLERLMHRDAKSKWFLDGSVSFSGNRRFINSTRLTPRDLVSVRMGTAYERYGEGFYARVSGGVTNTFLVSQAVGAVGNGPAAQTWKIGANAQVQKVLGKGFVVYGTLSGQYSDVPLYSTDQLTVGGRFGAKGLSSVSVSGERGLSANVELTLPSLNLGECCKRETPVLKELEALWHSSRFYAFAEGGYVENIASSETAWGVSAGLGFRANAGRTEISGYVGVPITRSGNLAGSDFSIGLDMKVKVF